MSGVLPGASACRCHPWGLPKKEKGELPPTRLPSVPVSAPTAGVAAHTQPHLGWAERGAHRLRSLCHKLYLSEKRLCIYAVADALVWKAGSPTLPSRVLIAKWRLDWIDHCFPDVQLSYSQALTTLRPLKQSDFLPSLSASS